jgi:hypothetical protein
LRIKKSIKQLAIVGIPDREIIQTDQKENALTRSLPVSDHVFVGNKGMCETHRVALWGRSSEGSAAKQRGGNHEQERDG